MTQPTTKREKREWINGVMERAFELSDDDGAVDQPKLLRIILDLLIAIQLTNDLTGNPHR